MFGKTKEKKRSMFFTSLLVGTAVASVAGAVYVAKDKERGGKIKAIKKLVGDVAQDGKTIYKSLTVDNVGQIKKGATIFQRVFSSTVNKLNIVRYFSKKDK